MITKRISALLFALGLAGTAFSADESIVYPAKAGPGQGRHVVFLTGDEEYRSEEGLPMLAKILSQRHGFKCTVLFPLAADGTIDPNNGGSLSGSAALDSADAIVMLLRFRHWSDDAMERFERAYLAGKPIIALRTSTHAFNYGKESKWAKYGWNNSEWKGGFGKQVFGETWVDHWAKHKVEATRGVIPADAKADPILRGVEDVFGDTDVYEAYPPMDAKVLLSGQALKGMKPDAPPADYRRKRSTDKQEQGINDPMMPVAWTRVYKNEAGKENKILCTTLGAATDLQSEGLRRLVVNAVYWGTGLEVPARADVTYVDDFKPTMYGFGGFRRGITPADHALGKVLRDAPTTAPAKK
jgi:hypothetical protein